MRIVINYRFGGYEQHLPTAIILCGVDLIFKILSYRWYGQTIVYRQFCETQQRLKLYGWTISENDKTFLHFSRLLISANSRKTKSLFPNSLPSTYSSVWHPMLKSTVTTPLPRMSHVATIRDEECRHSPPYNLPLKMLLQVKKGASQSNCRF